MNEPLQPVPVPAPVAVLPACPCKTTAECINWRYRQANEHAAIAIMAAIDAGRQLVAVKSRMVHGTWEKWIAANLEFSKDTAQNLMKMYAKSVGAERAALPAPVGPDTPVSEDEFAAAREKYPATSPAAFLKALSGDRSSNWGGDRSAAAEANGNRVGRHPKGSVGEQLDAAMNSATLAWNRIETHLEALDGYFPTAASVARLNDERLGRLFQVLFPLCEAAKKQLEARVKGNGKGLADAFSAEPGSLHPGQANL